MVFVNNRANLTSTPSEIAVSFQGCKDIKNLGLLVSVG